MPAPSSLTRRSHHPRAPTTASCALDGLAKNTTGRRRAPRPGAAPRGALGESTAPGCAGDCRREPPAGGTAAAPSSQPQRKAATAAAGNAKTESAIRSHAQSKRVPHAASPQKRWRARRRALQRGRGSAGSTGIAPGHWRIKRCSMAWLTTGQHICHPAHRRSGARQRLEASPQTARDQPLAARQNHGGAGLLRQAAARVMV